MCTPYMFPLGALGAAGEEHDGLTLAPPVEDDLPGAESRPGLYEADLGSARADPPKCPIPRNADP